MDAGKGEPQPAAREDDARRACASLMCASLVRVLVVDIGVARMRVNQRLVPVPVTMRFARQRVGACRAIRVRAPLGNPGDVEGVLGLGETVARVLIRESPPWVPSGRADSAVPWWERDTAQ